MIQESNGDTPRTLIEIVASRKNALTLDEFADLFCISYKTVWEMASQGRIPAIKIGSNWRLDPVVLAAWLKERTVMNALGSRTRRRS
jgi:excisionase family DNA binding protein